MEDTQGNFEVIKIVDFFFIGEQKKLSKWAQWYQKKIGGGTAYYKPRHERRKKTGYYYTPEFRKKNAKQSRTYYAKMKLKKSGNS